MRGMTNSLTIGERVAWYRRRRGVPQEVLAGRVGRTTDWLSKIENNRIDLDRLSVIRNLADALDISVGDLIGEPTLLDWNAESGMKTVPALRAALMDYRQLTPLLAMPSSDAEPISLDALRAEVGVVFDAYQASKYGFVAGRAPLLLADAVQAVQAHGSEAEGLLALSYQAATSMLTKLGETDLAWIAAERGLAAAQQAGNPVILGSLLRLVVHALLSTGRYAPAVQLTETAAGLLQPELANADSAMLSIYGSLFLAGSMAAARTDDRGRTQDFLREASEAADRQGDAEVGEPPLPPEHCHQQDEQRPAEDRGPREPADRVGGAGDRRRVRRLVADIELVERIALSIEVVVRLGRCGDGLGLRRQRRRGCREVRA